MTFYLKNMPVGQAYTASATIGGTTDQATISAHKLPTVLTGRPFLTGGQKDTDTGTVLVSGLTGVSYQWKTLQSGTLGTAATQSYTGLAGEDVYCTVTANEGVFDTPAKRVYMTMGMSSPMLADLAKSLATCPHEDTTHLAVADGNWSSASVWHNGEVPPAGATVLIPVGRAVTYDLDEANLRLDRVRVDGTLTCPTDASTAMLVETFLTAQGSTFTIGSSDTRVQPGVSHRFITSGQCYRDASYTPTNINLSEDPALWGRGFLFHGRVETWGERKLSYGRAIHASSFNGTTWDFTGLEAGATSLTLDRDPTGWQVGDTIIIGATSVGYPGNGSSLTHETEEREITGIAGRVISWAAPLTYDHDNQLAGSTRSDLEPVIMLKEGLSISFESEVTHPVHRAGHLAAMGMGARGGFWDTQFIGLGRTDKSRLSGIRDGNGRFRTHTDDRLTITTREFDATSSIIGRYALHFHHTGRKDFQLKPNMAAIGCYIGKSPGHAVVHHASHVDIVGCVAYEFFGCGFVGESGDETGRWDSNVACKATADLDLLTTNVKRLETAAGIHGDLAAHGYGFIMRGRAVNHVRNISIGCSWGHVFTHRGTRSPSVLAQVRDLDRANLDLKASGRLRNAHVVNPAVFEFVDYPLHLTAKNEAIACGSGMFIGKFAAAQDGDANARIAGFTAWGCWGAGFQKEYIGNYVLKDYDLVGIGRVNSEGARYGANMLQISAARFTIEGFDDAFAVSLADVTGSHENFVATDPRFTFYAVDFVDNTRDDYTIDVGPHVKGLADVSLLEEDLDGTALDFTASPSTSYPLVIGTWDGLTSVTLTATNASGAKSDNVSSSGALFPKIWGDKFYTEDNSSALQAFCAVEGHYQYDDGSGADDVVVLNEVITDRATGRPAVATFLYELSGTTNAGPNNGTYSRAASDPVQADRTVNTAAGTPVVIDLVTGATGGDGSTYEIWEGDYFAPRFGRVSIDYGSGAITYTPFSNHLGDDEMTFFLKSGNRFCTVQVNVLTGDATAPSAPVAGTHFLAYDHAEANTIGVQLIAAPDAGDRKIILTQYSTDGGTTWRRLCNGWKRAIHKVTVESDGTALAAGPYAVRLRCKTDYDLAVSPASGDASGTVT